MNSNIQYFPERFVKNRYFISKALKLFLDRDFDKFIEPHHDLRDFIRGLVKEWHQNKLPNKLVIEINQIRERLDTFYPLPDIFSNPENTTEYFEAYEKRTESDTWQELLKWRKKAEEIIEDFPRLEEETTTTKSIINFYKTGRNIFVISPFLITLLEKTDISNIKFENLKLPYSSIYLHFGCVEKIEYPIHGLKWKHEEEERLENKRYYLDGAFIKLRSENYLLALEFILTFVDVNDNFEKMQNLTKDYRFPTLEFSLEFTTKKTTIGNAVLSYSDICDKEDRTEIEYTRLHLLIKYPSQYEYCDKLEVEQNILIEKALILITNSLCYINYSSEKEISTTNEQATRLVNEQVKTRKTRSKNKIKEKLTRMSYSTIYTFGKGLKKEYLKNNANGELAPHWRRGHWRNQPFGEKLEQNKLIWIKPTIVRKDKGNPQKGHIYNVDN